MNTSGRKGARGRIIDVQVVIIEHSGQRIKRQRFQHLEIALMSETLKEELQERESEERVSERSR